MLRRVSLSREECLIQSMQRGGLFLEKSCVLDGGLLDHVLYLKVIEQAAVTFLNGKDIDRFLTSLETGLNSS